VKNIIEINGRSYDAHTGKLLAAKPSNVEYIKSTSTTVNSSNALHNGAVLDGVSRRKSFKKRPVNTYKDLKPALASVKNPIVTKLPASAIGPARQTEKTKTLLRNIVKKPFGHSDSSANSPNNEHKNPAQKDGLAKKTPLERINRAKQTMRSISIARFNNINRQKPRLTNNLSVTALPKTIDSAPIVAPTISKATTSNSNQNVFNHPIVQANNHLLKKIPKDKFYRRAARTLNVGTKSLAITASVLAVLIFGCFLAYQKIPSVAMRVAANRAGFAGHIPSTIPAGFTFKGPIIYSKDTISLHYKSNSDSRKFAIVQKPTEWNSESLLTNYLINSKLQYQTYQDSGLTVYVFNGGEATWVDKGVWYSVKGEGTLSFDQILSIASSM